MKYIILKKELAYLTCSGIAKALPESVENFDVPCCVPVYSAEEVANSSMPLEWKQIIHNSMAFGDIPPYDEMASGAVIGFVMLERNSPVNGIWTNGWGKECAAIICARMFDSPITVPTSVLENMDPGVCRLLPSHNVSTRQQMVLANVLRLNVNREIYDIAAEGGVFHLEMSHMMEELCLNEDGSLKEFEGFMICHADKEKKFKWHDGCYMETDDENIFNVNTKKRARLILSCQLPEFL